jgi:hypothetical protein
MAGVYKLEIRECEEDLKVLLRGQKTASAKERVYLLLHAQAISHSQCHDQKGYGLATIPAT